jgi:hypothetical protein
MKCQSFPLFTISSTASLCAVLLFWSGSIGLAAEIGLDTAKIESITGLKGVLNEKENSLRSANRGMMCEKHLWFPPAAANSTTTI